MPLPKLPNELLICIAENLYLKSLNSLIQTNPLFIFLLTPFLHKFAIQERDGDPAIVWAVKHGHRPLVSLLLAILDRKTPRNMVSEEQALILAVTTRNEAIVRLLLENKVNTECLHPESKRTALCLATYLSTTEIVRLLLENGADVRAEGRDYHTALHLAAAFGDETMVLALLEKGANVEAWGFRLRTPIAKILIDKDAKIDSRVEEGYTELTLSLSRASCCPVSGGKK